jgi:Protein of unknown function (DUF4230)
MADDYSRGNPYGDSDDDELENLPRRPAGSDAGAARAQGGNPPQAWGWTRDNLPPARSTPPATPPRPTAYMPDDRPPPRPTAPAAAPPPAPAASRRGTGAACIWLLALAAVIVLACGLLGFGAIQSGVNGLAGWVPRLPALPLVTPTVVIQAQGPSVVQSIRSLSRIETSQYTVERVLTGESTGALPPFTSDKILFIARGEVIAGVDLQKLTEDDVQVVSDTVTIRLPAPEILSSRLDNEKSRVYDRQTGIFTKADPNLESQVRQRAEEEIKSAALEDGILDKARENAETTLRTLLHSLKYDNVVFVAPSSGTLGPATTPTPGDLMPSDMTPSP